MESLRFFLFFGFSCTIGIQWFKFTHDSAYSNWNNKNKIHQTSNSLNKCHKANIFDNSTYILSNTYSVNSSIIKKPLIPSGEPVKLNNTCLSIPCFVTPLNHEKTSSQCSGCTCPPCPQCICSVCPKCICPSCPKCICPSCPKCICPSCPKCSCTCKKCKETIYYDEETVYVG